MINKENLLKFINLVIKNKYIPSKRFINLGIINYFSIMEELLGNPTFDSLLILKNFL